MVRAESAVRGRIAPRELRILKSATCHYLEILRSAAPTVDALGDRAGLLPDLIAVALDGRQPWTMGTPASIAGQLAELLGER